MMGWCSWFWVLMLQMEMLENNGFGFWEEWRWWWFEKNEDDDRLMLRRWWSRGVEGWRDLEMFLFLFVCYLIDENWSRWICIWDCIRLICVCHWRCICVWIWWRIDLQKKTICGLFLTIFFTLLVFLILVWIWCSRWCSRFLIYVFNSTQKWCFNLI